MLPFAYGSIFSVMQTQPTPSIPSWHGIPAEMWLSAATILAIVIGPMIAIQVEKYLESRREKERRKIHLFRELMVTRGTRLSARHVEALNGIQIEFSDSGKEKKVLDAWKMYMTHLNNVHPEPDWKVWGQKSEDLLIELLYEMSSCLGYSFEKDRIKREAYVPKHYQEIEEEQTALRKACLSVFKGEKSLKVNVQEEAAPQALRRIGQQ
jgi:hypothetical protein